MIRRCLDDIVYLSRVDEYSRIQASVPTKMSSKTIKIVSHDPYTGNSGGNNPAGHNPDNDRNEQSLFQTNVFTLSY